VATQQPNKKLYEYAILYHPKPTKDAQGNDTSAPDVVLTNPAVQTLLARDDKEVAIVAARAVPEAYLDKLDQVGIYIRPFSA
jgi:hypothetical protein